MKTIPCHVVALHKCIIYMTSCELHNQLTRGYWEVIFILQIYELRHQEVKEQGHTASEELSRGLNPGVLAIKKAECWRMDAFELWCWRRLLRVPWTARRSDQSVLREISPEYSLEGLIISWNSNTLAAWCEELTHWKRPWCWQRLRAEGGGVTENKMIRWLSPTRWTWVWASSGCWWWTWKPDVLQSMGLQRVKHDWLNRT